MNDQEKEILIRELNATILKAVPKASVVGKYGGTLYTLKPDEKESQFCGLFPYKDHVQLAFSQGTLLKDPSSLLQGAGKFRRHINFLKMTDIDIPALNRLLKEAAKISK